MTPKKRIAAISLAIAAAAPALAQAPAQRPGGQQPAAAAPAPSAASAPKLPSTPAKKALAGKIVQYQQPWVEAFARSMVEQPAVQMMQSAAMALQRVAPERRDAVAQDIRADLRQYVDENVAPVRDRAVRLAPTAFVPLLEERFTEDELKQIVAILESPVNRRFIAMAAEMQRALGEKLVAEMKPTMDGKLRTLQQTISGRFGPPPGAASAASR